MLFGYVRARLTDDFYLFYSCISLLRVFKKGIIRYAVKILLDFANCIQDMGNPHLIGHRPLHKLRFYLCPQKALRDAKAPRC